MCTRYAALLQARAQVWLDQVSHASITRFVGARVSYRTPVRLVLENVQLTRLEV